MIKIKNGGLLKSDYSNLGLGEAFQCFCASFEYTTKETFRYCKALDSLKDMLYQEGKTYKIKRFIAEIQYAFINHWRHWLDYRRRRKMVVGFRGRLLTYDKDYLIDYNPFHCRDKMREIFSKKDKGVHNKNQEKYGISPCALFLPYSVKLKRMLEKYFKSKFT